MVLRGLKHQKLNTARGISGWGAGVATERFIFGGNVPSATACKHKIGMELHGLK